MATVLITGGTGLIGRALTRALLDKGYDIIILSRRSHQKPEAQSPKHEIQKVKYAQWNIEQQTIDKDAIAKSDFIIHLAGAGVADKRWTSKRKQEIVDSRVKSGELLVETLKETSNHVKAVFSSSGIGWYGPDPAVPNPDPFTEEDPVYDDFLGETCKQWQLSIEPVKALGKRFIVFRTGIVLSSEGGALKEFQKSLKFGVAAILGGGEQMVSWIHIDDLVKLYITAIEDDMMHGVYNAVAPLPVSNKELTLSLAKIKRGKFFIPVHVPAFVLKMILGEMSVEVLKSATVSCGKVETTGFVFSYPVIEKAIRDLV